MSRQPIHEETIPFPTAHLDKFPVKAGIDRGSSLTKIAFIPKDSPTHAHTVHLRCLTFHSHHFVDALHVMKETAQLPDQGQLHVTGVGADADTYRHKIKEIVGLDVDFVDEMLALCCGSFHLVNHVSGDHIFYPIPDYRKFDAAFKLFDFLMDENQPINPPEDKFPALVLHMDDEGGLMCVDKDGKATIHNLFVFAGRCFMGMAHALIGTADYDEILDLAQKGNSNVADLAFADLLKGDSDSPYGHFPSDGLGFPFGRASEKSWDRSLCSREDLAASLAGHVMTVCTFSLIPAIIKTGARQIYASGNVFRSEYMRKMFYERLAIFTSTIKTDASIMETGYQGAIGAMLMNGDCQTQD